LASEFITAFARDFEQLGARVIEQVRIENPAIWLKVCGDLLPRETAQQLESNDFAGCETCDDVLKVIVEREGLQEAIEGYEWILGELRKIAAERAQPVTAS
jgi:hypothetical protein